MFSTLGLAPSSHDYPYSPWRLEAIRVTEAAIRAAWELLRESVTGQALLLTGTEPQLTAALRHYVEDLLNEESIPGFTRAVFGPVPRGQEVEDYTGTAIEKRPDLTFQLLSARPSRSLNALFYECKILGRGRTLKAYVEDGVARFVDGRYAWCMSHAGMIAYLVDAEDHAADAHTELRQYWGVSPPAAYAPRELNPDDEQPAVAVSIHARGFELRNQKLPGEITLRHVWLLPATLPTTGGVSP